MKAKILKIGNTCNNSCRFCFERGHAYETDTAIIKTSIQDARSECEQLTITGLEPTIHPDIVEITEFAKERQFKIIQIVSNGRMFAYKQFAREMVFAGMTELLLPIYSSSAKVHDRITGVEKSLAQTMAGIRNVKSVSEQVKHFDGVTINAGVVVCRENIESLTTIGPFLKKYGIGSVYFIRIRTSENAESIGPENARSNLLSGINAAKKAGIGVFTVGFDYEKWGLPKECAYEVFVKTHPTMEPTESFDTPF